VARFAAIAALCVELCACKHDHPTPKPTQAPAPVDSVAAATRQARFGKELQRAHTRWQEQPDLANCTDTLHEKADAELCRSASSALTAVEQLDPAAPPSTALPVLASASLALVRLLDRARYLNFEDFGRRRLEADGGVPAPSAGPALARPMSSAPPNVAPQKMQHALHGLLHERAVLKVGDSPLSHLVETIGRLEYDVLRNLSAYLEYAELPVRQTAFDSVKELQAQHPRWPTLTHVLREAAVLETDSALKQNLNQLVSLGLARGRPDQPTGSK
jgi:hypothetical protein